jgi:hypothetical protein
VTTYVIKYGALPPTGASADALNLQIRLALAYRRVLQGLAIELHVKKNEVEARLSVVGEINAEIAEKEKQRDELRAEAKRTRALKRGRPAQPDVKMEVKRIEAEIRVLKDRRKDVRKRFREESKAASDRFKTDLESRVAAAGKLDPKTRGKLKRQLVHEMIGQDQWPVLWRERLRLSQEAHDKMIEARDRSGLLQGTYTAIENSVQAAATDSGKRGKAPGRKPVEAIKIGVQCQGGRTKHLLEIASLPDFDLARPPLVPGSPDHRLFTRACTVAQHSTEEGGRELLRGRSDLLERFARRNERRDACRTTARVRVSSTSRGKPVWCELSIVQHCPLPPDASVRYAYVVKKRSGLRWRYELQLTVAADRSRAPAKRHDAVAVDIGWRRLSSGLVRAGYWSGSDGSRGEILVPRSVEEDLEYVRRLKSVSDLVFNRAIGVLRKMPLPDMTVRRWMDGKQVDRPIQEEVRYAYLWRAHKKLDRLVREMVGGSARTDLWSAWKTERLRKKLDLMPTEEEAQDFAGSSWELFYLCCWVHKDRHLIQWEADHRRRALARRLDSFRKDAARLAARYDVLILEGGDTVGGLMDLRKFVRRAEAEDAETKADDASRSQRFRVAPGEARESLIHAFGGFSAYTPEHTTHRCNNCGKCCVWDQEKEVNHVCEHCGVEWDQDYNAAQNLLFLFEEDGGKGEARIGCES